MLTFIFLLLFGLIIAFFAGQNTLPVTISLSQYHLPTVPLYIIIVGSMLVGFVVSWLVSLIDAIFNTYVLHKKDNKINMFRTRVAQLQEKMHALEIENIKMKADYRERMRIKSIENDFRPSIFRDLRHSVS